MRLRLVVPGLRWPGADRDSAHARLRAPTLARWLARGERRCTGYSSATACLGEAVGWACGGTDTPHAAISLRGEGLDPGSLHWLRADPVPIHIGRTGLALAAPRLIDLSQAEAQALASALREHFGDELPRLELAHPQRWYLGLPSAPGIETVDPESACGEDVAQGMPRGQARGRWLAFLNEVQMLWHDHPVNRARAARGLPPAASLWLHGAGAPPALPDVRWVRSCGPSAMLAGLAASAGTDHETAPPDALGWLLERPAAEAIAILPEALEALWQADVTDWQRAVESLDAGMLAAADRELARGRLREILLCVPSPGGGLEIRLTRISRWRLWRSAKALRFDA